MAECFPMKKKTENHRITLKDVATHAGVSAITVSRTIRSPQLVSESVRKRVRRSIDALGYVPDAAASTLASTRTDVIGLLIPSLTNSVFTDVLRGLYDALEGSRFSIQIANYRYSPETEEKLVRTFLNQKPAGMILAGVDQTEACRRLLQAAPCPVVQIMDSDGEAVDSLIGLSHFDAGRAATGHLADQGYRRIGFLGARMDPRSQRRFAGFRSELEERGLFDPDRVVTTPKASSVGLGGTLLSDLFARAPDTDAIFCNNDDLAAGVLFEAQRRGLRVPEDLGICGFNDLEMSRHLNPSLTSVATPRYRIGTETVAHLMRALETPESAERQDINLGFEVIPRGTTKRQGG